MADLLPDLLLNCNSNSANSTIGQLSYCSSSSLSELDGIFCIKRTKNCTENVKHSFVKHRSSPWGGDTDMEVETFHVVCQNV